MIDMADFGFLRVQVLPCTPVTLDALICAVKESLDQHYEGDLPPALFVVGAHVNPEEAAREVTELDVPKRTGLLMRTSGSTTGGGKIVAHSWDALIASANATHDALNGPGVWMSDLPLHHIAGFQTVLRSVLAGAEPVLLRLYNPAQVKEKVAEARERYGEDFPLYFSVVPPQLKQIMETPELLDALRGTIFLVGGAAVHPELLDDAREAGIDIRVSYGMTEACGGCVYDGVPIGDTEVSIAENGRISVTGSVVSLGYAGNVEPEAFTIVKGEPRTHHSNDAGRMVDGKLEVLGRLDDAILSGGLTIMPREIENAIISEFAVPTVVVAMPHPKWDKAAVAVTESPLDETQVRARIKEKLGPGWQPYRVVSLANLGFEDWPRTHSTKLDRRTLRERAHVYFDSGND